MLIREFTESPNLEDVDVKDDLKFFMHNDPGFYRRVFFPMIAKVRDHIKQGHPCRDDIFRDCVDKAAEIYCKKFNIADGAKSVFTDVDRDQLAAEIFGEERDRIEQGDYDRSEK